MTLPTIKCCLCGLDMQFSTTVMCPACLAKETDVTKGLSKSEILHQCRECGKWKGATKAWLRCEPESQELLALCLKKIKNLGTAKGARLIDASFVWTEEHSKRMNVKLVVESMDSITKRDAIRQTCHCEFIIEGQMCPDCQTDSVDMTWRAVVQIRQNLTHRRSLFFLEQEIIRRKLAEKASNIEESPMGMDIFFNKHDHALKFAEACSTIVPVGTRTESKKLTGQDSQNNSFRFRHTICLEIVPICKYDLCILPKSFRSACNKNGLVFVEKVARNLHIRDVETGKTFEIQPNKYQLTPFRAIGKGNDLIEFVVLDFNDASPDFTEIEVARQKDFGENDIRNHALEAGDVIMGYDMTNVNEAEIEDSSALPEVILLKRQQEKRGKRRGKGGDLESVAASVASIALDSQQ